MDEELSLTGRPLLDIRADAALFVDRTEELTRLGDAVRSGLNAAVFGERGIGKTSLLRRLALDLRREDVPFKFVDGSIAEDAVSLLELIRYVLAGPLIVDVGRELDAMLRRVERDETQMILRSIQEIRSALSEAGRIAILLDETPPQAPHVLFGRARDELWQLPISWIVAAGSDDRGEYLRPPADAFFEVVLELAPLPDESAQALLRARLGDRGLSDRHLTDVVRLAKGNPRHLIAAAREALAGGVAPRNARRDALQAELAKLGRPAGMLVAELEALGGASASDERLLRRLGWTRGRASQVLKQLEERGIVRGSTRSVEGGGRPRKVYELVMPLYR